MECTQKHFKCRHVAKLEDPDVRLALSRTLSNNISHRTGEGLPLWNAWNVSLASASHANPQLALADLQSCSGLDSVDRVDPTTLLCLLYFLAPAQVGTGSHQMDPFSIQLSKLGSARPFRCRVVSRRVLNSMIRTLSVDFSGCVTVITRTCTLSLIAHCTDYGGSVQYNQRDASAFC